MLRKLKKLIPLVISISLFGTPLLTYAEINNVVVNDSGHELRYTVSTIDPSEKGSITVYKYENNDGGMAINDGLFHSQTDLEDDIGNTLRPISGVGFTATKIADIESIAGNDGTQSSETLYTNVDKDYISILQNYGVTLESKTITPSSGGKKIGYTTASLEDSLQKLNITEFTTSKQAVSGEEALIGYAKNHATKSFPLTGTDGGAKIDNLDLGLYLITETSFDPSDKAILEEDGNATMNVVGDTTQNHQDTENPSSPYFVSVPMTNISAVTGIENGNSASHDVGTIWMYDVITYPKNQTTNIVKKIISPDPEDNLLLEDYGDYDIGDTVKQVIYADAPVNMELTWENLGYNSKAEYDAAVAAGTEPDRELAQRQYEYYSISDEMSEGLRYDGVTRVYIVPYVNEPKTDMDFENATGKQELVEGTDYRILDNPHPNAHVGSNGGSGPTDTTFAVEFTNNGLSKLNALKVRSQVVVYFDSTVTSKARIGTDYENVNQATLTWQHSNTSVEEKKSNETRVYTYELDLTKTPSSNTSNGTNRSKFDPSKVVYTVKPELKDNHGFAVKEDVFKTGHNVNSVSTAEKEITKARNVNKEGYILFVQETNGVYHVYDGVGTPTYTISPAKSGKLQIKGFDSEKFVFTETKTVVGFNLLTDEFTVELYTDAQEDQLGKQNGGGNGLTKDNIQKATDSENYLAANGLSASHINGRLTNATVKLREDTPVKLQIGGIYNNEQSYENASSKGMNFGVASMNIRNSKTTTLYTGGTGRYMLYGILALGALLLGVYVVISKPRKKENAA